jgi:hypothetical protein
MTNRGVARIVLPAALGILGFLAPVAPLSAQTAGADPEASRLAARAEVLRTVREALLTLGRRDVQVLRGYFIPRAMLIAVTDLQEERTTQVRSLDEFMDSLAAVTVPISERIWDPEVRVDGGVALVWAPYDLYIGGGFSHCGHDLFQFVDTEHGWKLASILYTVMKPPDCEIHPDGPPLGTAGPP